MDARSAWTTTARALKRAVIVTLNRGATFRLDWGERAYRVNYESRMMQPDRDYHFLQELARGKTAILDVGAHKGLTALVMAHVVAPDGRIYCFEASEDTCRLAQENIALNPLPAQIEIVNALIADTTGTLADFFESTVIRDFLGQTLALKRVTLSIDGFCQQRGVAPDLVKIDVEGAEAQVLRGMRSILQTARPAISCELHSWHDMPVSRNAQIILDDLRQVGYKMIYVRTKQEVTDTAVMASRGRCHVLLLPNEQDAPSFLDQFDTSRL
jgi:FkbM family methyltransferase